MTEECRDTTSSREWVERPSRTFGRGGEAGGQMTEECRDTTSSREGVERPSRISQHVRSGVIPLVTDDGANTHSDVR
jgi:hypothetical protein